MTDTEFGPSGEDVFRRTYARPKPDGSKESWKEMARRVAFGNMALVAGSDEATWTVEQYFEAAALCYLIEDMEALPAGRHLWATGVPGRQYLSNCFVAPNTTLQRHTSFTFLRLMEGGGVGSNYSMEHIGHYGKPQRPLRVHIVCDPGHVNYQEMKDAGLLSEDYSHEWLGAYRVEDSREGWAGALTDLLDTYLTEAPVKHGNRVFDVSLVRGKGAPLHTFGGTASGPGPLARMLHTVSEVLNNRKAEGGRINPLDAMEIDHAIAECVVSGGVRRSARMALVRWDDPFVFDFIEAKKDGASHWTTNISVEIDGEFIQAVTTGRGSSVGRVSLAREVYSLAVAGMTENGEPGFWNGEKCSEGEPNGIIACNPCGEQELPPAGSCVLGHVNLDAFAPKIAGERPDLLGMIKAHRLMARAMIRATFQDVNDYEQAATIARDRRIGVGHFGVQAFLAKCGIRFSEAPQGQWFCELLIHLQDCVREAAREYAFELRIPEPVKVTTVAPTGTIAKIPGTTEGIHPLYAKYFEQRIRYTVTDPDQADMVLQAVSEGFAVEVDQYDKSGNTMVVVYPTKARLVQEVEDMGLPASLVESVDEISLADMLDFQAMYQTYYADAAVSFTVNFPPEKLTLEEAKKVIARRLPLVKGTTLMPDGSREQAPYTRISRERYEDYANGQVADGVDEDCLTGACPVR